jgi:hypothetical protein
MGIHLSSKAVIRRTRSGRHQKAAGAWSWYIRDPERQTLEIGGYLPVSKLFRCPNLTVDDSSVASSRELIVDCACKGKCPQDYKDDPFEEVDVKNTTDNDMLVDVRLHLMPSQIIGVSSAWWKQNKKRLKGKLSDEW